MSLFSSLRPRRSAFFALSVTAALASADEAPKFSFGGAGWLGYGSILHTTDTLGGNEFAGKPMISSGAQIVLGSQIGENLEILAGVGAGGGHYLVGSVTNNGGYAPFGVGPYVAQANLTYHGWKGEASGLFFRAGLFAYDYAPENQNLGLYLLRGPVYPGFVLSGFETKHVLPVANMLGLQLHHQAGRFSHDLLLQVETEFYPFYDLSPAYVASFQAGSAVRIGAGINFQHLIPVDPRLTTDTSQMFMKWVTEANDTVQMSARGVKLMARASIDFKDVIFRDANFRYLSTEDLTLYGEAALFGLENSAAHKELYGGYADRMPKMIGFTIPTFKLLDRFAVEFEHYSAPFRDDLARFNHTAGSRPSPIPLDPDTTISRDDIKWSVYGSKVIQNHIKISFQVASDHFRPGVFTGYGDNNPPGSQAILQSPWELYLMSKIAYFF